MKDGGIVSGAVPRLPRTSGIPDHYSTGLPRERRPACPWNGTEGKVNLTASRKRGDLPIDESILSNTRYRLTCRI